LLYFLSVLLFLVAATIAGLGEWLIGVGANRRLARLVERSPFIAIVPGPL